MKLMHSTALSLAPLLACGWIVAQTPSPAAKPAAKESPEAQNAKKMFVEVLDAVDAAWFGKPYQGVNALDLDGNLSINLSAAAVNAKVETATQGIVKNAATKSGRANLRIKGTWLAKGDFRCEIGGDAGQMLWTRVGNRGFIYSKDLNAYTTAVDLPPADAPLTYLGFFRQMVLEAKAVYVDSGSFKATLGTGDDKQVSLIFSAPTAAYDPKKREQSLDDTLGFWKRGRLEVTFDKATKLPKKAFFQNDAQGVKATMSFSYGPGNRLQDVAFDNQSRGMEGPMWLKVSYGSDGLMRAISGEMSPKVGRIAWDFNMGWAKDKAIALSAPPVGADKKGKEDHQALVMVNLAGSIMDLQRFGLNFRSVIPGK